MNENVFKQLRESTETDAKPALTQGELSNEFAEQGNTISQSFISKLEKSKADPPTTSYNAIKAYSMYFNVTADYLLGLRDTKQVDENISMINKVTGLSEKSINALKQMRNGNEIDDFFETLNYLISKDFNLFVQLVNAIELYFDENFDTSMTYSSTNEQFKPINKPRSTIINETNDSIYIGHYDEKLCNGNGGYRTKAIPTSLLKESYSIYAIQRILEELKQQKEDDT